MGRSTKPPERQVNYRYAFRVVEVQTVRELMWDGPGIFTDDIRALLKRNLQASFSDEQSSEGKLAPDCIVQVDVGKDKWYIYLRYIPIDGWPSTKRQWAETQVQSSLLSAGILLPPGKKVEGLSPST